MWSDSVRMFGRAAGGFQLSLSRLLTGGRRPLYHSDRRAIGRCQDNGRAQILFS